MLIRILTKPIVVDCFTWNQASYDLFRPSPAVEYIPEWWKNTPVEVDVGGVYPVKTLRTCDGFVNLYKQGFVLPMWSDLAIAVKDKNYRWQYSDNFSQATVHYEQQWNSYAASNTYGNIKLHANWRAKSKQSLEWFFTTPSWNYRPDNNWYVAQGLINYSKSRDFNVNLFVDITKNKTFVIPVNSALAFMVPLTDKKVVLKHHLVTKEEYERYAVPMVSFNRYNDVVSKITKSQKSKCPFHFGS